MPTSSALCIQPSRTSLRVVPTRRSRKAMPVLSDAAIRVNQKEWDRYFQTMFQMFHRENPDLNRDLALDRTIRALGQRPLKQGEFATFPSSCSGVSLRTLALRREPSWRELHLQRKFAREDAFESLCDRACNS